jgi:uncharacterized membrane protein YeiH
MKLLNIVEILGTMAFAFSGALSAMRKRLDVFGVLILTFITAIGGGTIRDLLIGSLPVAWILDIDIIVTISITYLISLFFLKYLLKFSKTIFWFDTVGLAVFCVIAMDKALSFHLHLRDVLLNEIPYVFRKDIYASACIAGGIVFFASLYLGVEKDIASWIAGISIFLIRVFATYFSWRLPLIYVKGLDNDR